MGEVALYVWFVVLYRQDQHGEIQRVGPLASEPLADKIAAAWNKNVDHDHFYIRILKQEKVVKLR